MKLSIRAMPSAPVIAPITKDPTSKTIDPFNRISRHSSASIRLPPPEREASQSAETMAGASIAAATATI